MLLTTKNFNTMDWFRCYYKFYHFTVLENCKDYLSFFSIFFSECKEIAQYRLFCPYGFLPLNLRFCINFECKPKPEGA